MRESPQISDVRVERAFFQHFYFFLLFPPSLVTVVHDVVFSFNFTSHTITVQKFFSSSYEFFNFFCILSCGSKCLDEIFLCRFFFESEIFFYYWRKYTKKIIFFDFIEGSVKQLIHIYLHLCRWNIFMCVKKEIDSAKIFVLLQNCILKSICFLCFSYWRSNTCYTY